jgi:fucose permease
LGLDAAPIGPAAEGADTTTADEAAGAARAVARRRLQWACYLAMVVFAGSVTLPGIVLPAVAAEFHLELGAQGLLATLRMAALLVGLLICGGLADRFGKGPFLTAGMLLAGAGAAWTALAGDYAAVIMAQAVIGLGTGAMEALVNPLVAELHRESPARPLNITNAVFSLGLIPAALLSGEMLEAGYAWRATLWPWVLPGVAAALLAATRRYPRGVHAALGAGGLGFLRRPLFWLLVVGIAIGGGVETGMTFWGPSFMERELSAPARAGAVTVAFFGAFMAAGRFASGGLLSRVRAIPLTIGSAAACALATAGLCLARTQVSAWAMFGLGGLFVACFWPTILAIAAEEMEGASTAMFAVLAAAGISGCALYPWGIGLIADAAGLRAGLWLMPAGMVAQVFVMGAALRLARAGAATSGGGAA